MDCCRVTGGGRSLAGWDVGASAAEFPGLHGGRVRDPVHGRHRLQRRQITHQRPCLMPLRRQAPLSAPSLWVL